MSDIDTMIENIQAAMDAMDSAHKATEDLRARADRETLEKFQAKMKALHERLEQMQQILTHEASYMEDEAIEAIGAALGSPSGYHRIPHFEVELRR